MPSGRLDDGGGGGTVVPDGATFEEAVFARETEQFGDSQIDVGEFFSTTPWTEGGGDSVTVGENTYESRSDFLSTWEDEGESFVIGDDPWQPVRDGAESLNVTVDNGLDGLDELLPDWLPWAVGGTLGTVLLLAVVFIVGQLFNINVGGGS